MRGLSSQKRSLISDLLIRESTETKAGSKIMDRPLQHTNNHQQSLGFLLDLFEIFACLSSKYLHFNLKQN